MSGQGLDGMRAGWLDWLAPWVQYRTEVEDVLDAGDRAHVITRDFGRREGSVSGRVLSLRRCSRDSSGASVSGGDWQTLACIRTEKPRVPLAGGPR